MLWAALFRTDIHVNLEKQVQSILETSKLIMKENNNY